MKNFDVARLYNLRSTDVRTQELQGIRLGCAGSYGNGGSAWESNPAPPRWRGATDFEDREGHRAPFASITLSVCFVQAENLDYKIVGRVTGMTEREEDNFSNWNKRNLSAKKN